MNANEMLLSIRDLSIAFGSGAREFIAVDRVSFDIGKGETVAVVGESGSGKSVTALSVMKLLPYPAAHHPSGSIMFKGRDLLPLSEREMRHVRGNDITIIFQEPMTSLNPLHTIEKQIGEILELHQGVTGQAARARILDLLDQVGIPDPAGRLKSYPHQLSGGMRSRVALARSLVTDPTTLLMDEPFSRLDAQTRALMHGELLRIHSMKHMTVVFVTHDVEEAVVLADEVAVMSPRPGRVRETVAIDLPRPRDPTDASVTRYIQRLRALI